MHSTHGTRQRLGSIIGGSLAEGLLMRLDASCSLEDIKTGKFVCVQGQRCNFFSLITNVQLQVTDPSLLLFPPGRDETLLQRVVSRRDTYATIRLKLLLTVDAQGNKQPVKTIPAHFSPVFDATAQDIAQIFGSEEQNPHFFSIGTPLDMDMPVCIDLDRFVERSNGVFGKTGTGKTFITRVLLAGLIKTKTAVNLVFDMHSEYGFQARQEGTGKSFVKGLKTLFGNQVAICSLDPESTRKRGCSPDVELTLSMSDIAVDDVMSLQDELNLHQTAIEAAYLLSSRFGRDWLKTLLMQGESLKEFANQIGAHPESLAALYRKLKRLERFPFLVHHEPVKRSIDQLFDYLARDVHVILEFGKQTSMLCYLLVANIITRRIHEEWVARTERFLATHNDADRPQHLVITIEEAHKFLNPVAAKQTIFGIIAREMRKYYVSLLVVDQRPSGIDEEVLSQLGTKIIAQLNDDKDIQAALTGVSNAQDLRAILAGLDSKKQALALGHALPMPVVLRTREYDEQFYAAVATTTVPVDKQQARKVIDELFG